MTPRKLFLKRLTADWRFKYGIWKTTIDWTVALYIVLPALAFGIHQYLLWWEMPLSWLYLVPRELFFAICYLFAWSGSLRIFLEEADQIFLLHQKKWLKLIIKQGLIYSFSIYFLFSIVFFILLAPFLLQHYHFSHTYFISLFLITLLLKIFLGLVKQFLTLRYNGWKKFIMMRGILVLGSVLFMGIISNVLNNYTASFITMLFLAIFSIILTVIRINLTGSFLADVAQEQSQKLKYVSFLLNYSGTSTKKPRKQRIRPWLFYHSNLIFKKRTPINGLVELCIKAVLRNNKSLWEYLQITIISVLVVLSIPGSIKLLIWLVLAFVWVGFVSLYWKEIMASDFLQMFKWKPEDRVLALQKFLFLITLPGFLLLSIIMGFQTFSWIGAFFLVPISSILLFYICRRATFYLLLKN